MINKKKIIQHILIILFFLIVVFVFNKIPDGYIISGGDFYQLININDNITRNLYTWFNNHGQGQYNPLITTSPFYIIQYFLYNIGLNYSQITNFLIFQFLILSFYSFYFAQNILFKNLKYKFIGAFGYTFNLTVIAILFYPWIVTHHVLIYIFIPLIIALFVKYIKSEKIINKEFIFFNLFFIISLVAFNNLAFLFVIFLIELLIFFIYLLYKKKLIYKLIIKGFLLLILQILISSIIILPFISAQYGYTSNAISSKALGGDSMGFVKATSSSPLNTFRLKIGEWNFMENTINNMPNNYVLLFSLLSFIYIFIILFYLINNKENNKEKNIYYIFLILYIIFLFLSFRLTYPFDLFNLFFYKKLTLGILRSPDKIAFFLPFLTIVLFVYSINNIKIGKRGIYIIYFIMFLSIIFILNGGIIKQYSYKNNNYSNLVKIPNEYYKIQKIVNLSNNSSSILSIPYSVVNSINWSNYQKWGYLGHDILHLLYNKNYISANSYDHIVLEDKQSLKSFSDSNKKIENLIKIIQKFGGRYIINHKDIENKFLGLTTENLEKLTRNNVITLLEKNEYFELYELKHNYINPLINGGKLNFKMINPIKYKIDINIKNDFSLIFLQSYNPKWKLYLNKNNSFKCKQIEKYNINGKKVIECEHKEEKFFEGEELKYLYEKPLFEKEHKMVYDYANSWTISKQGIIDYVNKYYSDELKKEGYPKKLENGILDYKYYKLNPDGSIDTELTLYFKPQSYFYLGLIISGTTFLFLILWLIVDSVKNRKKIISNNK